MNRGMLCFSFLLGAAVGAVSTWFIMKARYDEELEFEEFDPEEYRKRRDNREEEKKSEQIREDYINPRKLAEDALNKPSIMEYAGRINKEGYKDYTASTKKTKEEISEAKEEVKEEMAKDSTHDYIEYISPDEFGENDEYETTTWTYFSDGVLADDANEAVNDNDISNTVGLDFANHFGEFEPDAVHVRNDDPDITMYFEILRDERTFDEFLESQPEKPRIRRENE